MACAGKKCQYNHLQMKKRIILWTVPLMTAIVIAVLLLLPKKEEGLQILQITGVDWLRDTFRKNILFPNENGIISLPAYSGNFFEIVFENDSIEGFVVYQYTTSDGTGLNFSFDFPFIYLNDALISLHIADTLIPGKIASLTDRQISGLRSISIEGNLPGMEICVLSVTDRCNLHCQGCYATGDDEKREINRKEILKIVNEMLRYGVGFFVITGGEPLMKESIITDLGKIRRASYLLFTNGTLLNSEKIEKLRSFPNIIPVLSFEGSDRLTDQRRGQGVAQRVNAAIGLLKKKKIGFGVSVTATKKNLLYLLEKKFYEDASSKGALIVFVIDYVSSQKEDDDLVLDAYEVLLKEERIQQIKKESDLIIINLPADESPDGRCIAGGTGLIHVNAYGEVQPCQFYQLSAGNILERDLIEILKSEPMVLTRLYAKNRDSVQPCHKLKNT